MTAQEVIQKWRAAVHATKREMPVTAILVTTSNQDAVSGSVEEWITTAGAYRRVVKREFDNSELVLTDQLRKRRDWNGFVRDIEGQELKRLRTAIFEREVIVFGPPASLSQATVSESADHQSYLLKTTAPGGLPVTWHLDAKTWLPLKSVHPGDDTEVTTLYEDWREAQGMLVPARARVSETDKPDYRWERTSLNFNNGLSPQIFKALKPGPSDVHLAKDAPPIPFNFENSHIMFKVSVNGRAPIWFILDTGADQEVINAPRLAEFGLQPYAKSATTGGGNSAEYDYAQGATFTLPGVELRNQHVAVLDQSGIERALGMPLGGILGHDFISRFVVEIDYQKQLIILHDPESWKYSGRGYIVPVTFDDGIPFTNATISVPTKPAIPAYMVLDSGAAETMTLTSPFVKSNDLLKLAQTNSRVLSPAGLEKEFFAQNNVRGHIAQLALGELKVKSIPANFSVNVKGAYASQNFAGTIGESIFRRFHLFLDYARHRIILEPTAESEKPFPERRTYGLTLLSSGADLHTYTVAAVRPASPAEEAGFKKGDVIELFDNKPAAQFTLGELRDWLSREGEHYSAQVMRGADHLKIPIEIRLVSIDRQ